MPSVAVNHTTLWYSDKGQGDAVLVVHGAGSDGRIWAKDLRPLASTHRVIAYNRRGYPGSGRPVADWKVHAEDAAALITSLDVAPIAVVAHSAGSIVALELAVKHPELLRRLVLLDPAFGSRRNVTPKLATAFVKTQMLRRLGCERRALDTWLRFATSYRTGGSAFQRMGEDRRDVLRSNAEGIFSDLSSHDGTRNITVGDLRALRVPVTIITAELSPTFLQKTSASLAKYPPTVTTRGLNGAGHAMAFDQSAALHTELRRSLGRPPTTSVPTIH